MRVRDYGGLLLQVHYWDEPGSANKDCADEFNCSVHYYTSYIKIKQ